ncbi:hypothetical protein RHGRI_000917 [Rhododendron griersonianum]|uniref:cycloartenol synthase n=1 Tax=Rhododendron griersonianum TaxID=479676 RepID=A0AAV6LID6_9ERIC|nr:hypothetical protein RHGRI_000917 [Rhododendron griersonianum]
MWKLKIGEGGSPWLRTLNGHTGRQHWEFDPDLGSPEDLEAVENARDEFRKNRFHQKHSADLLMRIQFNKDNPTRIVLPQVKVTDTEDITEDQVTATLRRALSFHSTLQAHDGHWPGDYGGPMFLMPGLVITLSVTGALNTVLSKEHKYEMCRYLYNHQARMVLNMLCCWVEDPNSEAFKLHIPRLYDYLWLAEDGMKMQVLDDCPGNLKFWYRHISKGAWPFSTADHGWPISDCTAEGLKAALLLSKLPPAIVGEPLDAKRLYDAVNVTLSLQNSDGGFATYELTRSYSWLELFNPAETFGDIVIDYPYVECTSAAIQALASFKKLYPGHRREEIESCIERAALFIEKTQAPDGSWYGSWGVCFTYGAWFGIQGLVAAGKNYHSCSSIRKACDFLLSKQEVSGGWGESYLSCQNKVYSNIEGNKSHIVHTAWAMLALICAGQVPTSL